jgi:hypothetical protein
MSAIDPMLRSPRTAQYSLSVQHEAQYGVQLQLAYIGNMGRHLLRQPNINMPTFADGMKACLAPNANGPNIPSNCTNVAYTYTGATGPYTHGTAPNIAADISNQHRAVYSGYGDITQYLSDAVSNYNSLQFTAEKRRGILTLTFNCKTAKRSRGSSSTNHPQTSIAVRLPRQPTPLPIRSSNISTTCRLLRWADGA